MIETLEADSDGRVSFVKLKDGSVKLKDGSTIEADTIVIGIGAKPAELPVVRYRVARSYVVERSDVFTLGLKCVSALTSNLPQEWLEGAHLIIQHLRPVSSVAMLRIAFRIVGPVLPRLANAHNLFNKTLSLLLAILVDVFGKNTQPAIPVHASEITDLIDFLHHVIHYEGQNGPVQVNSKPRPEVLALFGRASDNLRPDVQHLLSHLKTDPSSSIYAATHPKFAPNPA